ncbi:MAG: ABC transporter substrate-binding protein [Chloroflexota bacterium]
MRWNETLTTTTEITTNTRTLDALAHRAPATDDLLELADWLATNGSTHLSAIERIELAERLITRRRFLIGAGALGLGAIVGCGSDEEAVAPTATTGATRMITHPRGDTKVPTDPQRVVLANDFLLGNALSLGVPVIGAAGDPRADGLRNVPYDMSGVEIVGTANEPNLEQVLELEPDLIIAIEHVTSDEVYNNLSAIAPTIVVATTFEDGTLPTLFAFNETFAEIVGRTERIEEQLSAYESRLSEVRSQLDPIREEIDFNILSTQGGAGTFTAFGNVMYDTSAFGVVIRDLGLVPDNATEGVFAEQMSIELINEWDADVLVTLVPEGQVDGFFEEPLVEAMNAVQASQLFEVPQSRWNARYIDALTTVLDDLEEFLIESNPDLSIVD